MGKHNIGRYEKLMIFFNKEMKDNIPYSADDLLSLCKSIDSQADKTTIYNVTYKMKVANYIRSTEDKKYIKIPIAEKETVSLNDKVNDAIACIQKALSSYQSFNWLNCSESELLSTRQTFKALKKLSLNISDLFYRRELKVESLSVPFLLHMHFYINFSFHSVSLKPTSTLSSSTTKGRFTSIPFVARSLICSSSLISESLSFNFISL
jgi:hypothetical protein